MCYNINMERMAKIKKAEEEEVSDGFKKKVDELKFNDKIDDKYTSNVLNKYEKGHQRNRWLAWSGGLSILFGITCIITMVIVGMIFVTSAESLQELSRVEQANFDKEKSKVIACAIAIPIMGILSIIVGVKVYSYSNYTREMLMEKSARIMFVAFIQFFVSACIFSLLTVIGYFVGRGIDYGAIYYNKIEKYDPRTDYYGNKNYYENGPFTFDEKPYISKVDDNEKHNLIA